jgi:hypothetical protein
MIAQRPFFLALGLSPVFHRKILRQDRLGATIAHSVDLQHPSGFVFFPRWFVSPVGSTVYATDSDCSNSRGGR